MKSRLIKKLIAYGLFPLIVFFLIFSPLLDLNTALAAPTDGGSSDDGCAKWFWNSDFVQCTGSMISGLLVVINMILGLLLYLIGILLDFAINFSINPAGDLYRSETVGIAWNLLRDIINMSFIFILLYIAIGTVLNINGVDWKKQVSQIVIAAILVNFSLFITRVVIDAGNILAHGFYTEMVSCETTPCPDGNGNPRDSVGISERFMNALGIQSILELWNDPGVDAPPGWEGVGNGVMQTITILVAMWVFLSAAILFIARTFALVFILVLSPIGVAGANLPLLNSHAKKWREELFKQSMLGVVFLFFMFVILTFASREESTLMSTDIPGEASATAYLAQGSESRFIIYMLVIAGLVIALRLTKSMSSQVGKFADGFGKAIVGGALGVATGGAALAGRAVIGGAARNTLANETLKAQARSGNKFAQARLNMASGLAKNSFDVRQTALGGRMTKNLEKQGFRVGVTQKAGKGGRDAAIKKSDEIAKERSKRYAMSDEEAKRQANESNERVQTEYHEMRDRAQEDIDKATYGTDSEATREGFRKEAKQFREQAERYKRDTQSAVDDIEATYQHKRAQADDLDREAQTKLTTDPDGVRMRETATKLREDAEKERDAALKDINEAYQKAITQAEEKEYQATYGTMSAEMREQLKTRARFLRERAESFRKSSQTNPSIIKQKQQEAFAASIENDHGLMGLYKQQNKSAANAIRKEINKKEFDKLIDAVKAEVGGDGNGDGKKDDKKEDGE